MKEKKRPVLIDIEAARQQLGISEDTLYRWIQQRKIPYYKIGRGVRFEQGEIDDWIMGQKVEVFSG